MQTQNNLNPFINHQVKTPVEHSSQKTKLSANNLVQYKVVNQKETAEKLIEFLETNRSTYLATMQNAQIDYMSISQDRVHIIVRNKNNSIRYYLNAKEILGTGTSKIVRLYYDFETSKPLAFGNLTNHDPAFLKNAEREFKIMKRLQGKSEHILKAKFWATTTNQGAASHSIVAKKCDGSLEDLFKLPLTQEQKISVIKQLVDGYAKIHAEGYVHRDVKPANIFYDIDKDGKITIKIADFGFACKAEWKEKYKFAGSPLYFSPELCHYLATGGDPKSIDLTKLDVWALGLICYQIYKGEKPNHVRVGEEIKPAYEIWLKALSRLGSVSGLNKEEHMELVIAKMVDCNPDQRISAAKALVELNQAEQKQI